MDDFRTRISYGCQKIDWGFQLRQIVLEIRHVGRYVWIGLQA